MHEYAIKLNSVSKDFKLTHEKKTTVKSAFVSIFKTNKMSTKQHALKNIDISIKKGEFFGIVGRNGSGKSTLLKILAGIYQPTKGSVEINGRLVPFIELGVGFNPELTGRENVYLNGALLNFSKKEVDAFYDEVVAFAELEKYMDKKLKNYSSGMQVRLAFSMAIQAKADILLIDEVLAVGDADFQRKCFNYFDKLKKNKATVIFVSHDMDAVRKYCDRAMLIDGGVVKVVGKTEKVAQEYTKMFTSSDTSESEDESGASRWGDRGAYFKKIQVKPDTNQVEIVQHIFATKDINGLIAGIRLRNASGVGVLGSNTKLEHASIKNIKAGQSLKIVWRFANILSDGQYTIDPALLYDDEITVADWWDDAVTFVVKKSKKLPYPIDTKFSVELVH